MQSFRSATGVLVLSTALMIGSASGAIAAADTGTGDSGVGSSSTEDSSTPTPASSLRDSVMTTVQEASSLLSGRDDDSTLSPATGVDADAVTAAEDADEALAAAEAEAEVESEVEAGVDSAGTGEQSVSDASATATEADASVATDPEAAETPESVPAAPASSHSSDSGAVAVVPTAAASKSGEPSTSPAAVSPRRSFSAGQDISAGQEASVGKGESEAVRLPTLADTFEAMTAGVVGTATTVVVTLGNTVTTVVVSLGNAVAAIPPAIWALPTSQTPFSDVIALVEAILHSVTQSATAVMRFPSDLVTSLGIGVAGAGPSPVVTVGTTDHRQDFTVPNGGPLPTIPALAPLLPSFTPVQQLDEVVSRSLLAMGTPPALAALSAPGRVIPASIPGMAGGYESLFDRAFGAMLVPLSLWALATGALPGLVGLLVVFGAGARVGYRQAKAGLALKVSGIARFAGTGPLGVVRSGSFVALHHKAVGVGGSRVPRLVAVGDQAA